MNEFFFHFIQMAYLFWDPDKNFFVVPYVNHPVTWYGFLFASSFFLGYFIVRKMFSEMLLLSLKSKDESDVEASRLTDQLALFVTIGGIVGARLGHVLFYDWPYYKNQPLDIFKIWEGGLASHGGAIGILIALLLFVRFSQKNRPRLPFSAVLDAIVIPTALAGGFIRLGNFINQEITGIPTQLPWGVIFGHPIDGIPGIPVHPVQLYEALFYFLTFSFLIFIWLKQKTAVGKGIFSGWFFLLIFGFRFVIEFLKMPQNEAVDRQGLLMMGQWLSLPFIILGAYFLLNACRDAKKRT